MTSFVATSRRRREIWAITGVAGFIGSHLLQALLALGQRVVGLDNFATGHPRNLDEVKALVEPAQWARFRFIEGDIGAIDDCRRACGGADYMLHQAALGSVPRSFADPIATNAANVTGFLNMLVAARDANVRRFVYAASSATYGDHTGLPKVEEAVGRPLEPVRSHASSSTSSTPRCSPAATASSRSGCATSTCSARGRTPTALTPR